MNNYFDGNLSAPFIKTVLGGNYAPGKLHDYGQRCVLQVIDMFEIYADSQYGPITGGNSNYHNHGAADAGGFNDDDSAYQQRRPSAVPPCYYVALSDSEEIMWGVAMGGSEAASFICTDVEPGTCISLHKFAVTPSTCNRPLIVLHTLSVDYVDATCGLIGDPHLQDGMNLTDRNILDRDKRVRMSAAARGHHSANPLGKVSVEINISEMVTLAAGGLVCGLNAIDEDQNNNNNSNNNQSLINSSGGSSNQNNGKLMKLTDTQRPLTIQALNSEVRWQLLAKVEWVSKMRRGGVATVFDATSALDPQMFDAQQHQEHEEMNIDTGGSFQLGGASNTKRLIFDARLTDIHGNSISVVFSCTGIKQWHEKLRVGIWIVLHSPRIERILVPNNNNNMAAATAVVGGADAAAAAGRNATSINAAATKRRHEEVRSRFGNIAGVHGYFLLVAEPRFGDPVAEECSTRATAMAANAEQQTHAELKQRINEFHERRLQRQQQQQQNRTNNNNNSVSGAFLLEEEKPMLTDYSATQSCFLSVRYAADAMERFARSAAANVAAATAEQFGGGRGRDGDGTPFDHDQTAENHQTGAAAVSPAMISCVMGIVRVVHDITQYQCKATGRNCPRRSVVISDPVTPLLVAPVTLWDRAARQIDPSARGQLWGFREVTFTPPQIWDLKQFQYQNNSNNNNDLGRNVRCVISVATRSFSECVSLPERRDTDGQELLRQNQHQQFYHHHQQQQRGGMKTNNVSAGASIAASALPSQAAFSTAHMTHGGGPPPLLLAQVPPEQLLQQQPKKRICHTFAEYSRLFAKKERAMALSNNNGNAASAALASEPIYLNCRISHILTPLVTWICSSCGTAVEELTPGQIRSIDIVVKQARNQHGDHDEMISAQLQFAADGNNNHHNNGDKVDPTTNVPTTTSCLHCGARKISARFRIVLALDDGFEVQFAVGYQTLAQTLYASEVDDEVVASGAAAMALREYIMNPKAEEDDLRRCIRASCLSLQRYNAAAVKQPTICGLTYLDAQRKPKQMNVVPAWTVTGGSVVMQDPNQRDLGTRLTGLLLMRGAARAGAHHGQPVSSVAPQQRGNNHDNNCQNNRFGDMFDSLYEQWHCRYFLPKQQQDVSRSLAME